MPILARGEQQRHRLGDVWVTFEGSSGAEHDMTDGQFLRTIQRGGAVAEGTRVRVSQADDRGSWFEIWRVLDIERKQPELAGRLVAI
jgi:hypothetical protein